VREKNLTPRVLRVRAVHGSARESLSDAEEARVTARLSLN
jgi:hypothetical protein